MATIPERIPYIQSLNKDWHNNKVTAIDMLRLDVVHSHVSGNKWYKLQENIRYCIDNGIDTLITFGGGYSNHLAATAVAAKHFGLKSIAIVRGDYRNELMTPTLEHCTRYGMMLDFVSYEEYKLKNDNEWLERLMAKYPGAFIIPEGGANELGRLGVATIADYIPDSYTHIAISVGTGTTIAGLANSLSEVQQILGYVPMKGGAYLKDELEGIVGMDKHFELFDDWHFGGFGKSNGELIAFMNSFYEQNNIPLDVVYTSKMMFGVRKQIISGYFDEDTRLLCIHTGGLQGNAAVANKLIY